MKKSKKLNSVKVIFNDAKYNYSTSISGEVTKEEAENYFIGKSFNLGAFPIEDFQTCKSIEFINNNLELK